FILFLKTQDVLRHPASATDDGKRAALILLWLIFAIPLATGMASFFTFTVGYGNPSEAFRLHARYYAFLYLVAIVGALSIRDWDSLLRKPVGLPFFRALDGYRFLAFA